MNTRRYFAILLLLGLTPIVATCASGQDTPALMNPASLTETAPDTFRARFETSKGEFVIEVERDWAPNGADRFYNLVKNGFYDDCRFFRVVEGFMVQFGINGTPEVQEAWRDAQIAPDPVRESNRRGYVTYAMAGSPDTRTTQIFINFGNNDFLDPQAFAPFGRVAEGMDVVEDLYAGYGDGPPSGRGPQQGLIQTQGNGYLNTSFPELDYVTTASIVE